MKTNEIALEDLVTLVCTEFVKQNKDNLQRCAWLGFIPYLKLNYKQRRKISEKILESLGI